MEFNQYARVFLKRGWIILLVAVITAASAVIFAKTQQAIYRSTAILQVIPARPDFGLTMAAENLLRQFCFQIQTPERTQKVIDQLELDIPPERLLEYISAASRADEFLIQIDVDWPDPETTQEVANALATDFAEYQATRNLGIDRRNQVDILVLEPAKWGRVQWPKPTTLTFSGAILGLLLGGLLAFGLEYLEAGIIRSPQDVERYVKVAVIGTIPAVNPEKGAGGSLWRRKQREPDKDRSWN
jgi:capsular polysaccharide biosynthesis protein